MRDERVHVDRAGPPAEAEESVNRAVQIGLFGLDEPRSILRAHHYLGDTVTGDVYQDEIGVVIVGSPSSRMMPQEWAELKRWCIVERAPNAGSRQWARVKRWIARRFPEASTVISYSDPSAGHDGALYRACGWLWAPTWHRLRPPPSGGGSWDGRVQQVPKDRWVFPMREDPERAQVLQVNDSAVMRAMPWAGYVEPTWRRGVPHGGGGDWRRWRASKEVA